jgi:hypothetical protein
MMFPAGLVFSVEGRGSGSAYRLNDKSFRDGKAHHIVLTFRADSRSFAIWVDGVQKTITLDTSVTNLINLHWQSDFILGHMGGFYDGRYFRPIVGTFDDVALYPYILDRVQIAKHYKLGTMGSYSVSLAERVQELAEVAGIDSAHTYPHQSALDTVVRTKAVHVDSVSDELGTLIDAYGARIHSDPWGQVSIYGEHYNPAPVVSFTDDQSAIALGNGVGYMADDFTFAQDRSLIANEVEAQAEEGSSYVVRDRASIARYGKYNTDLGDIRATRPTQVRAIIGKHLYNYKNPSQRLGTISVVPDSQEAWEALAKCQVSSVVEVTYRGTTKPYFIEGVEHDIAPKFWRTTLSLSPAVEIEPWIWDTGTWGTETRWT